jgi:hypothetical protein
MKEELALFKFLCELWMLDTQVNSGKDLRKVLIVCICLFNVAPFVMFPSRSSRNSHAILSINEVHVLEIFAYNRIKYKGITKHLYGSKTCTVTSLGWWNLSFWPIRHHWSNSRQLQSRTCGYIACVNLGKSCELLSKFTINLYYLFIICYLFSAWFMLIIIAYIIVIIICFVIVLLYLCWFCNLSKAVKIRT